MHIWVDADACPVVIKEILFRVAQRVKLPLTLVANRLLRVPPSPYIKAMQVPMGFDVADNHIVEWASAGDLVITADIPLAAALVEKDVIVLNPRGELYNAENIREILTLRNFTEALRGTGVDISGPASFSQGDRQAFARQLDRLLARRA
ncbi:MAG: YaiI/YqxD family protein [Thiobacillus sp.]